MVAILLQISVYTTKVRFQQTVCLLQITVPTRHNADIPRKACQTQILILRQNNCKVTFKIHVDPLCSMSRLMFTLTKSNKGITAS